MHPISHFNDVTVNFLKLIGSRKKREQRMIKHSRTDDHVLLAQPLDDYTLKDLLTFRRFSGSYKWWNVYFSLTQQVYWPHTPRENNKKYS